MLKYKIEINAVDVDNSENIYYTDTVNFSKYVYLNKWLDKFIEKKEESRELPYYLKNDNKDDGYLFVSVYAPNNNLIKEIWFDHGSGYNEMRVYNENEELFWQYLI